jgi:chemotaxis protein methyltransferase CheR
MIAATGPADVDRFRRAVARRLGLVFDDARLPSLAETLSRRLRARKLTGGRYLAELEAPGSIGDELGALVDELTVAETYFFRNVEQLDAFADIVLPERLAARAGADVRILSAGCASGEEAYSLAIVARERMGDTARAVTIRAVDVSAGLVDRARRARYAAWSLRDTSAVRRRWFRAEAREFVLDPDVAAQVTFEARNLAVDDADLWPACGYDVVFCRNVLMYFTPEVAQAVIARIARALAPGGYLFLGHVEHAHARTDDFDLRHTHGAFYYRRTGPVQRRPADALAAADALPADDARVPLLHAVLLVHGGRLAAAEGACRDLLAHDRLHAGAHYLLGLCRDAAGDPAGAAEHHRVAAHLDPAFALPRVQLGVLARRSGDVRAARRELGHARELLHREDAARLRLYGAGFGRDALLTLCEAELVAAGARSGATSSEAQGSPWKM